MRLTVGALICLFVAAIGYAITGTKPLQTTAGPAFVLPVTFLGCLNYEPPEDVQTIYGWIYLQPVRLDLRRHKTPITIYNVNFLDPLSCSLDQS